MSFTSRNFFLIVLICSSIQARAEWLKLVEGQPLTFDVHMDMDTVKQTGPMSIYRQARVLSQGPGLRDKGIASKVDLSEYDCMNGKRRIVSSSVFAKPWAEGESTQIAMTDPSLTEWHDMPQPLGQHTISLLCPSGKDD